MRDGYIRSIFMPLLLLMIANAAITATTHADEFNTMAVQLDSDLGLTLQGVDTEYGKYDIFLEHYVNPSDPEGNYWKFVSSIYAFQQAHVNIRTFQYSTEEPLERHCLDIYYPDNPQGDKVVIFVPGGAWRQGDKQLYSDLGTTLAGIYHFTTVIINYRLSSDDGGNAIHPDHINDVATAFTWVKNNISEYGDSSSIYIFGQSAGAHLVSLLATDGKYLQNKGCSTSDIKGVISMSAMYNLPAFVQYPDNPLGLDRMDVMMYKKIMLDAFGSLSEDVLSDASPVNHISSSQPPFLVIYTYKDLPGFALDAENFVKAVKALPDAPEISLRKIEFSDYSNEEWKTAQELASAEPAMADYVGHYAEVMPINPKEQDNYVTRMVVDFIRKRR